MNRSRSTIYSHPKNPVSQLEVPCSIASRSSSQQLYYAVAKGRYTGIFRGWNKCKQYIDDCKGALFWSFSTYQEAAEYIQLGLSDRSTHEIISKKRTFTVMDDHNTVILDEDDTSISSASKSTDPQPQSEKTERRKELALVAEYIQRGPTDRSTQNHDESISKMRKFTVMNDHNTIIIDDDTTLSSTSHSSDPQHQSKEYMTEEETKLKMKERRKVQALVGEQSAKVNMFLEECSKFSASRPLGSNYGPLFMAILLFDGGCRTLPGVAGAGAYLRVVKSSTVVATPVITVHKVRWYSDKPICSMAAEYYGLLHGLHALHSLLQKFWQSISDDIDTSSSPAKKVSTVRIQVYGDSLSVIENMRDNKVVRKPKFQAIHASCIDIVRAIQQKGHAEIKFQHIYRKYNQVADGLANEAMKERRSWTTIENGVA